MTPNPARPPASAACLANDPALRDRSKTRVLGDRNKSNLDEAAGLRGPTAHSRDQAAGPIPVPVDSVRGRRHIDSGLLRDWGRNGACRAVYPVYCSGAHFASGTRRRNSSAKFSKKITWLWARLSPGVPSAGISAAMRSPSGATS